MKRPTLGQMIHGFVVDHLQLQRGLRRSTVLSYRDALRLFLLFLSRQQGRPVSRLTLEDVTFDMARGFLCHLEAERGNQAQTRNQRRAVLLALFEYLASRCPEMMGEAEKVAAIPTKRSRPSETCYLSSNEIRTILDALPMEDVLGVRDRALLVLLYNTGARVQEVVDLRVRDLDLGENPSVRLHGKGDKWRTCPLWKKTVELLNRILEGVGNPDAPVFLSRSGRPLTRYGIYKIVRRRAHRLESEGSWDRRRRVTPHVFRHTAAVHLLEAGVEVNVIRGWLGHASIETTYRYAEITTKTKEKAIRACEAAFGGSEGHRRGPVWRHDKNLLGWLESL